VPETAPRRPIVPV
jgi:hypothetical protein